MIAVIRAGPFALKFKEKGSKHILLSFRFKSTRMDLYIVCLSWLQVMAASSW